MYDSPSPRDPENQTHASILSWPLLPSWILYPPAVYSSPLMTMVSTLGILTSMLLGFPLSRAHLLCAPLPTASQSRRPVPSSQPRPPRHCGGDQHLCHALFEIQKSGEVLLSPSQSGNLIHLSVCWPPQCSDTNAGIQYSRLPQAGKGMDGQSTSTPSQAPSMSPSLPSTILTTPTLELPALPGHPTEVLKGSGP